MSGAAHRRGGEKESHGSTFPAELDALRGLVLQMGGRAEAIVQKSIEALKRRDAALARKCSPTTG